MSETPSTKSSVHEKHGIDSIDSDNVEVPVNLGLERTVWRKLDLLVLPTVAMFYLLSFLDRTNIANARVAGLQKDLNMTNKEYSIVLTVTYIPYILAELPSNLVLKAVVVLWVAGYSLLLGLLEGGVFPGLVLYLSYFYPRYKMNLRVSSFFAAASLSGAFSGILAYGIIKMHGLGGRPGWSWIFIIEGLFTVAFGAISYFILPRSVDRAYFLTQEEKDYVNAKLREDSVHAEEQAFSWQEVIEAFKLPQLWIAGFVLFLSGVTLYSLAYFSPSIIQGLGYTAARAQLMSVPPFAVAFVISMICAFVSDKYRCRGYIVMFSGLLATIGFAMFLGSKSPKVRYGSLFFSIPGTYTSAPTLSAWQSNNASPQTRRATAIAFGFIMSNSGGILATWLLGSLSPAPQYTSATITLLVFSVCILLGAGANVAYLKSQNKKKAEIRKSITRVEEKPGLGDRSAWFIYNL
ncbi:hypothetical protein PM082_018293 [Marasmius tenuissimus]|nr:hypothetical protein PM082_018293 [Marasmius tenuissimus]